MNDKLYIVVLCIVLILLIVVGIVYAIIHNKNKKYVLSTSGMCDELNKLNKNQNFHMAIPSSLKYTKDCKYKYQYDDFDFDDYLMQILINDERSAALRIEYVLENIRMNDKYLSDCGEISTRYSERLPIDCKIKESTYKKIEKSCFDKMILNPPLSMSYYICVEYTSPKGQNSYHNSECYDFESLKMYYYKSKKELKAKQSYEYRVKSERAKMTDSIRYDVLKRDGFKCQICGASAQDGATLHVDHIIPVSKGGKTEMSNLQTLCDRCNLGKSNKL